MGNTENFPTVTDPRWLTVTDPPVYIVFKLFINITWLNLKKI